MNDLEFKVNKYILLRLEGKYTVIYVNGKRFINCKRLLLNIPKKDVDYFDRIRSIDEVSELYDHYLINNNMYKEENGKLHPSPYSYYIPPETEFWGHCSNIQAWVEHEYDTRILHSNLAFPILKKLYDAGDPRAKKVFKEEIALRFLKGNISTKEYLVNEKYLIYLNKGELVCIFEEYLKLLETSNFNENTAKEARFMINCSLKYLNNTACKEILEIYKQFLNDKKSIKEICFELGSIYIKDLKYEEAIKLYKIVLSYDSNDIDVLIELGILYRLNQKFKKSPYWLKKDYKKTEMLCPKCKLDMYAEKFKVFINKKKGDLLTPYKGRFKPIEIRCKNKHEFKTTPGRVYQGSWCPICSRKNDPNKIRQERSKHDLLEMLKTLKYDILSKYENINKKVRIKCPKQHEFTMTPKHFKRLVNQNIEPCLKCRKHDY